MKAVFFDLDGVLVSSEIPKHEIIKDFLREKGYPIPHERFFIFIGAHKSMNIWDDIFEGLDPSLDRQKIKKELHEYRKQRLNNFDYGRYRMEHIVDLLNYLKDDHYKIACASSSNIPYIHDLLQRCKIEDYFDLIVSCDDFKHSKPAPDIYLYCAKKLGLEPRDCVVVEDSTYGIAAGKAAKMTVIAKNDHYFGIDQHQADYHVEDMMEIVKILAKLK